MVDNSKLQAVTTGSDHSYGSKEDDSAATRSLSEIKLTENQSQESMASVIMKSLGNLLDVTSLFCPLMHLRVLLSKLKHYLNSQIDGKMIKLYASVQSESSTIRDQLLNDFVPDDVCPLGPQLYMENPKEVSQFVPSETESVDEVIVSAPFL